MTDRQAAKIIYELERQKLMKTQGETLAEIAANIDKAKQIVRDMTDGTAK